VLWFVALLLALTIPAAQADDAEALDARARAAAETAFAQARQRHWANTNHAEAAWQFGRAAFDLADLPRNRAEREAVALEGIAACRTAVALDPALAAAHYYLAMNLGQLARIRLLRGLGLVAEMERAFLTARDRDARFDHGGPDRNLGLLYARAPGWPLSVGDEAKGRRHLEQAVRLSPDYPDNRLSLAEELWDAGRRQAAARELEALEPLLPAARARFAGTAWDLSWRDWDARWESLRAKAGLASAPGE
jgi:tetratricopeptide (TPR) repeat protein